MAELTNAELALLNSLVYLDPLDKIDTDRSVADVVNFLRKEIEKAPLNENGKLYGELSREECRDIINTIDKSENLKSLKMHYVDYNKDENLSRIVTFVDKNNEATVIFKGTDGEKEWGDNVRGAIEYDTDCQKNALRYIDALAAEGYKNITVSGHSKGGNKAQYVAIMSNAVDNCVSFDGQGFSNEFLERYKDRIAAKRNSITSIAADKDFVNCLLNQIAGKTIYISTDNVSKDIISQFAYYHKPNVFVDANGNMYPEGKQSELSKLLHEYSVFVASIEDKAARDKMFDFLANLLETDSEFLTPEGQKKIMEALMSLDNSEITSNLLAYTIEFMNSQNLTYDKLINILSSSGFDTSDLQKMIKPEMLDTLLEITKGLSKNDIIEFFNILQKFCKDNDIKSYDELIGIIKKDKDAFISQVLDFKNINTFAGLVALAIDLLNKQNLDYEKLMKILNSLGIDIPLLKEWYMPSFINAILDAAKTLSKDEILELFRKFKAWCDMNGIKSYEEFAEMIKKNPLLLLNLYMSLGIDKKTLHEFFLKLLSPENVAKLIVALAKEVVITLKKAFIAVMEFIGEQVLKIIGIIYLTAQYILKIWDQFVNTVKDVVNYIKNKAIEYYNYAKDKVAEIYNTVKEKVAGLYNRIKKHVKAEIGKFVDKVCNLAKKAAATLNKIKNGVLKTISRIREAAVKAIGQLSAVALSVGNFLKDFIKGIINQYKYRDFSQATRNIMLNAVKEVGGESWWDVSKWDCWYRIERMSGLLNLERYANNVNDYYRKIIDINNMSKRDIENIFRDVDNIDRYYSSRLNDNLGNIRTVTRQLSLLADAIKPN